MGMYTECTGVIHLPYEFKEEDFENLKVKAEKMKLSERVSQCIYSTMFHQGQNSNKYLFIGGEMKDYDDDWQKWCQFLKDEIKFEIYEIKTQYEENEFWLNMCLS